MRLSRFIPERWRHDLERWQDDLERRRDDAATPATHDVKASRDAAMTDGELAPHLALGRRGEELAAEHLRRAGYRLVASNFKLNVGRNRRGALVQAEIDIVAYDGATLCFVEVKTRASDWFAAPEANVDLRKQRQISRAARAYRRLFGLADAPHRYDVVAIILPPADAAPPAAPKPFPRLRLFRNFWTDDKFRKRHWTE